LEAVFASDSKNFEVIVVDDSSTDSTLEKVKKFPCRVVELKDRKGPGYARMIGAKEASCDIMVFIDSDILIANDTISRGLNVLGAEQDAIAVVGLLSKHHPNQNFSSVYKNLYMNYIFNKCPRYIDFIYGSFFILKKGYVDLSILSNRFGEDTALGMQLANSGYKIVLDKTLEVVHLKRYTFFSFIRNDFRIPYYWSRLFIQYNRFKDVLIKKRFCHANREQLLSLVVSPAIILSFFVFPKISLVLVFIFLILNISFFSFLYRERGIFFTSCAVAFTFLDMLVMVSAIGAGFISYFLKPNVKS